MTTTDRRLERLERLPTAAGDPGPCDWPRCPTNAIQHTNGYAAVLDLGGPVPYDSPCPKCGRVVVDIDISTVD